MPNIRWLLALITAVHRALYRATGGRIGARAGRARMLLLETVGRRTGQRRVTPLLYVEDAERFVVVASNAGDDRAPAWFLNLRKQPAAVIQVGAQRIAVAAREASTAESERLWPKLIASYRHYRDYRTRTQRRIPIVVLEPTTPQPAGAGAR
jgi:deazaflavin-dependent oxidoreductase (nitroreductase family)